MNGASQETLLTGFLQCKPRKDHKALFTAGYVIPLIEEAKISGVRKTDLYQPDSKMRVTVLVQSTESL